MSELREELVRRAFALTRDADPPVDIVGELDEIGASMIQWDSESNCLQVSYGKAIVVFLDGGRYTVEGSYEVTSDALEDLRKHMVLDDLADV